MANAVRLPCVALCWLLLLGCADGKEEGAAGDASDGTECQGDFDLFAAGLSRQALPGDLRVELTDTEPAPPSLRTNTWWLQLRDAEGGELPGCALQVTPYMPKHQHASPEVVISELGGGQYQLSPIDFIMPGVWEIPIVVTPPGAEPSEAVFRFCIAER